MKLQNFQTFYHIFWSASADEVCAYELKIIFVVFFQALFIDTDLKKGSVGKFIAKEVSWQWGKHLRNITWNNQKAPEQLDPIK